MKSSVERSYYAIFHALRSVTALDDFVIVSRDMAEEQLQKTEYILHELKPYLESKWEE